VETLDSGKCFGKQITEGNLLPSLFFIGSIYGTSAYLLIVKSMWC